MITVATEIDKIHGSIACAVSISNGGHDLLLFSSFCVILQHKNQNIVEVRMETRRDESAMHSLAFLGESGRLALE